MVSSLDGKATLDWRTKGLSSDLDRRVFHLLRSQADAVMVGAGTVRAERYGRITKSDELRQIRVNEGLVPDALAVVVSGRLDLPADLPLLNEPDQKVVIATASEDTIPGVKGDVEYARVGDDLPRLMAYLQERHAVRSVLCEGGPTLNSFLFAANLVDELFLTLTAKVLGERHRSRSWRGASWWSRPSRAWSRSPRPTASSIRAGGFPTRSAETLALVANPRALALVINPHGSSQDRARGGAP